MNRLRSLVGSTHRLSNLLELPEVRRARAVLVLSALLGLFLFGLRVAVDVPAPRRNPASPSDAVLHGRIVAELERGASYYQAVGSALRQAGYPTRSVFNWRTPLHYNLVASLSPERAKIVLRVLAIAAVGGAMWAFVQMSALRSVLAGYVVLGGMLVPVMLPDAVLFAEACAGTLIALSIALYTRGRWFALAACLGLVAVFLREIAVPYAFTCGLLAIMQRRRRETLVWVLGGLAYFAYYGIHAINVSRHVRPTDIAHLDPWLLFQGLPFVLRTLHGNGAMVLLPVWVTVLACTLALAAIIAAPLPRQVRWSLLAYLMFFSAVGQPFNFYWGWVAIPLWTYAIVSSDLGLRRLFVTAFWPAADQTKSHGAVGRACAVP